MYRESFIDIQPGVRIRYRRSEPPPPLQYATALELLVDGRWTTIRLWDNAHEVDEHHEHGYTAEMGKQSVIALEFGSANEAMAAAIREARTGWRTFLERWEDR